VYLDNYFDAVDGMFRTIRETQRGAIESAAEAIAASMAKRGAWVVMDTGHLLKYEAFLRAGGLVGLSHFSYELKVDNPMDQREADVPADAEAKTVALALDNSKLKAGDVLLINSNSGRTPNVIEVALQCRERGITTIALCSKAQLENCEAAHVSGNKLFDVADICIDNCGPHGDALIEAKDNERMCPGSGMAGAYILWAIQAEAVERLQAQGLQPTIYRSVHVGGHAFVEEQQAKFKELGI
jgi:uncharacterized phosphosugar-binding protein